MAPELHRPEAFGLELFQRTYATDVFAFGCVCLEVSQVLRLCLDGLRLTLLYISVCGLKVCTSNPPFSDIPNDTAVLFNVMNGLRPKRPSPLDSRRLMSDKLWNLIGACWSQQISDRPSMSAVVEIMKGEFIVPFHSLHGV
jgi:hypothetical protein